MPPRVTDSQRKAVLAMLAQGCDRETVAAQVGVTPGQVLAVAAHVKMRTIDSGIIPENRMGWDHSPPAFASLQEKLQTYAQNTSHP